MTRNEAEVQFEADKRLGFDKWMAQPATRLMLSMIPPSEKQEILETLLRETFNAGFTQGCGSTMSAVIGSIIKDRDHR